LATALDVDEVTVSYGGVLAVDRVSFVVPTGGVVAILGPNGAGKSSLLRAVSGLVRPASGSIRHVGRDITGAKPHHVARSGLALVPEGRRVIAPLSVEENLLLAGRGASTQSRGELKAGIEWIYEVFPRLSERRRQPSGLLSGGEQQMLAVGRALITKPSLIMMDEPSMGLAPIIVDQLYDMFRMPEGPLDGIGIVLVEQSAERALHVATAVHLMARGRFVFSGTPADLDRETSLREAYLGTASHPL
jgi:branched-chain amino acid transport system ATP-binding protein